MPRARDLAPVLGHVRLHAQPVALGEGAEPRHQLGGARGHEARREDRLHERRRRHRRQLAQQPLRLAERRGRAALDVVVGRVAVHVDLAHEGALALRGARAAERERRVRVQRAEVHAARRAVLERATHGVGAHGRRVRLARELGLGGEGVRVEPVEQLQVVPLAREEVLRRVRVRVHEAGHQEAALRQRHRPQARRQAAHLAALTAQAEHPTGGERLGVPVLEEGHLARGGDAEHGVLKHGQLGSRRARDDRAAHEQRQLVAVAGGTGDGAMAAAGEREADGRGGAGHEGRRGRAVHAR